MKQNKLRTLYEKDMTKKILASLLSILIGLVVGSVIIAAVGFSNPELGASSVWDGIRIVFAGLFSTGRTAAGKTQNPARPAPLLAPLCAVKYGVFCRKRS